MTTISLQDFTLSPNIVLGKEDHRQLTVLAMAGSGHSADASDDLLHELDRASVVPDESLPPDVVRMGSSVTYRSSDGSVRQVVLVFPSQADIAQSRISVMTPVGTALIGLRKGQSITWTTRDGRKQVLTVLAVLPPADGEDGDDPGPMAA